MNRTSRVVLAARVVTMILTLTRMGPWTTALSTSLKQGIRIVDRRQAGSVPASSTVRMMSSINPDRSAASQSRPAFRMPRNSADDSKVSSVDKAGTLKGGPLTWNPLGLYTELVDCLQSELGLPAPTPVQSLVIPELLNDSKESLAFLAATGSGKTLAYLLPLMQQLKQQEQFEDYERRPRRPRLLILAPTRELAVQITQVMKSLSHSIKLSSQALVGGLDRGLQRKGLAGRPVDVVVATPGRLLQHWKDGSVFLGGVETIVLDEMDTMLEQGFQRDLREVLYPLLFKETPEISESDDGRPVPLPPLKDKAPRIVLTSATMTQTIQKLLGDNPKTSKLNVSAKKLHGTGDAGKGYNKLLLPPMRIVSAPGLHKSVPRLEQIFVDVGQTDKISLLVDVISSQKAEATIVFCNTAASVRATQYALAEARVVSLAYHGELNSAARSENLKKFRAGAAGESGTEGETLPKILVCTDLAARGLDIPQVDQVVMFDFPLNAMDYLHRSGRTARGAGRGRVTALVAKRDKVLATAIQQAVMRGDSLDGLSSRKSDYLPGSRFGAPPKKKSSPSRGPNPSRSGLPQKKSSTTRRSLNKSSQR